MIKRELLFLFEDQPAIVHIVPLVDQHPERLILLWRNVRCDQPELSCYMNGPLAARYFHGHGTSLVDNACTFIFSEHVDA